MGWKAQVESQVSEYSDRAAVAKDRCIVAIRKLGAGNEDDVDVGLVYSHNLESLLNAWGKTRDVLVNALDSGNSMQSLAQAERLRGIMLQVEGLAHASEARVKGIGRRPGTPAPAPVEDAIESEPGQTASQFPAWLAVVPIGLLLVWFFGR